MRQHRAAGMPVLSLMRSTSHGRDPCWCLDASLLECEGFFGKVTCALINLSCWLSLGTCLKATVHEKSLKCSSRVVLGREKKPLGSLRLDPTV